jgi:rSAM/selenodomain-associated transferase 1
VPPLSFDDAAELARALLLDQLQNLARFTAAQLFIAFTPPSAASFFEALLPREASCFCQQGDSLGDRMRHAFAVLFSKGFSRVVLIGGDLPAVPLEALADAVAALEKDSEIVLGPSLDGGYYLVGMSRLISEIFEGIRWSQPDVLTLTTAKLVSLKKKYKLISPWYDIDTIDDLRHLESDFAAAPAGFMKNTLALLQKFRQRGKLI